MGANAVSLLTERPYQSPPGSGANDGALPKIYDPIWSRFTNLTPAQILAFESFPQDLVLYAGFRRYQAEVSGITIGGIPLTTTEVDLARISQLKQAFDSGAITQVSFFDANNVIHTVDAAGATAIYFGVVQFVQATYDVAASLQNGALATPPTVTTRKQIDAAIAAVAPNSPSAANPSPT